MALKSVSPGGNGSLINRLYNMIIEMDIPGLSKFSIQAILDTGCTTCCIDRKAVPAEALEALSYSVTFNCVSSVQESKTKVKNGMMTIGEHRFRIPFTYAIDMTVKDGIQMLVGCNFIKANSGGLRIEGTTVTFYKNITTLHTTTEIQKAAMAIPELDMNEEEYRSIQEAVYYGKEGTNERFVQRFSKLLQEFKAQGYIGEDPLKHWSKNQVTCKIDIINPDLTIQDKPLKHVTPATEDAFKKHITALLQLGVIRPSKSRHRTMAMIVQSGTFINPKTKKEEKGKERMTSTAYQA
ncbi:hypothetical protein AMTR_s00071p00160110 [Amborella trichopoda]|uniref:Retropepsins domain-containing protein n=1 Tax=Amborella trichopoda TaxID=13333 RepID=U5DBV2_AMBTC|nr:hypothetical protein AMTR_s00071p00160110 [Amborella trichopoda]